MDLDDYTPPPYQPPRRDWRGTVRGLAGPVIAGAVALAKWTFVLVKFAGIFIAVGAYALFWGWKFAVGMVLLILVHEMGHYLEAKREGLDPKLPVFLPFVAYVRYTRGHPWQTVKVAIAGPILGGVGALACYLYGRSQGDDFWLALGYFGFFLNAINMIPVGILDGGAVWQSARWLRIGGGGARAMYAYALYFGTALALVAGMVVAHVPRSRV